MKRISLKTMLIILYPVAEGELNDSFYSKENPAGSQKLQYLMFYFRLTMWLYREERVGDTHHMRGTNYECHLVEFFNTPILPLMSKKLLHKSIQDRYCGLPRRFSGQESPADVGDTGSISGPEDPTCYVATKPCTQLLSLSSRVWERPVQRPPTPRLAPQ